MTYQDLYEKAIRLLDNGEITIGEYEEMIKPLKREICEWIPVSEELPKPSHRVGNGIDEDWRISSLIAMKIHGEEGIADSYEIGVAEFSLNGEFDQWYFGNDGWYDKDKVIAWKYVEPYREDGE